MTGPQDPAAAGRDQLRAGHADRERVIEALKTAFVRGQLTRDELGIRAGQALAARTGAELTALTADIPGGPAAAGPVQRRPDAVAGAGAPSAAGPGGGRGWRLPGHRVRRRVACRRRPRSGWPGKSPSPLEPPVPSRGPLRGGHGLYIVMNGVATSVEQRRSRRPPPRPGRRATRESPAGAGPGQGRSNGFAFTSARWRRGDPANGTIDPLPGWEPGNPAAIYVAALRPTR